MKTFINHFYSYKFYLNETYSMRISGTFYKMAKRGIASQLNWGKRVCSVNINSKLIKEIPHQYKVVIENMRYKDSGDLDRYEGNVHIGSDKESWDKCIDKIHVILNTLNQDPESYDREKLVIGLDTEFSINIILKQRFISTIQLSFPNDCFIFQTLYNKIYLLDTKIQLEIRSSPNEYLIDLDPRLKAILNHKDVVHTGVNIKSDADWLKRFCLCDVSKVIDLRELANRNGHRKYSLEYLAKEYLNIDMTKGFYLLMGYDWDISPLPEEYILYAALDAICSRMLYEQMNKRLNSLPK